MVVMFFMSAFYLFNVKIQRVNGKKNMHLFCIFLVLFSSSFLSFN